MSSYSSLFYRSITRLSTKNIFIIHCVWTSNFPPKITVRAKYRLVLSDMLLYPTALSYLLYLDLYMYIKVTKTSPPEYSQFLVYVIYQLVRVGAWSAYKILRISIYSFKTYREWHCCNLLQYCLYVLLLLPLHKDWYRYPLDRASLHHFACLE